MNEMSKKPYVKPELERVLLVPEEAVLAGCKTALHLGPQLSGYCYDAPPVGCSAQLS